MTYPTKYGLSVHKGRFCKGRRTAKKLRRRGTVADTIITRMKVEIHQETYEKVMIGSDELENIYAFTYLGGEIPGDGDLLVPVKHMCDVAWGRFKEYKKTLMSSKLPKPMRCRLFDSLVSSTMSYKRILGCRVPLWEQQRKKT